MMTYDLGDYLPGVTRSAIEVHTFCQGCEEYTEQELPVVDGVLCGPKNEGDDERPRRILRASLERTTAQRDRLRVFRREIRNLARDWAEYWSQGLDTPLFHETKSIEEVFALIAELVKATTSEIMEREQD
jgi:hypothetical protein